MAPPAHDPARYDRQERIPGWDQAALQAGKVLLVGAGATGNEVLKNLALLGVGRVLVVDLDAIETTNLCRTVLFRPGDEGHPKAEVAAERARELNPECDVRAVCGDVTQALGPGAIALADVVIGCVDNAGARLDVSATCQYARTPFLDCGIWALDAGLRVFAGDGAGPCFECVATPADLAQRSRRYSCTGLRRETLPLGHAPTTLTPAALIGALTAQEAARLLCGQKIATGCEYNFEGAGPSFHRTTLPRRPVCPHHEFHYNLERLDVDPAIATADDLRAVVRERWGAEADVSLTRELATGLWCPHCASREVIACAVHSLGETSVRCPRCGAARQVEQTHRLEELGAPPARPLRELGVPDLDLVGVATPSASHDVILTGGPLGRWLTD